MAKAEIRMTEGPIAKQLISFAIPLFLGFLFQQLYNTADALIVGNLLGNSALAAVTGTGTLIFLLVGFFGGISMGAGVVVSRFFGSREVEKMRAAIHTNIAFGMAAGVFLTVVGMLFTPQILQWMGTPEDVMPQSVAYIRTYFAGSIGLVMYNQCRGVMQGVTAAIRSITSSFLPSPMWCWISCSSLSLRWRWMARHWLPSSRSSSVCSCAWAG